WMIHPRSAKRSQGSVSNSRSFIAARMAESGIMSLGPGAPGAEAITIAGSSASGPDAADSPEAPVSDNRVTMPTSWPSASRTDQPTLAKWPIVISLFQPAYARTDIYGHCQRSSQSYARRKPECNCGGRVLNRGLRRRRRNQSDLRGVATDRID